MNTASRLAFLNSAVLCALAAVVSFFLETSTATAKRSAPQPVAPVTVKTIEYSAPHDAKGFVVATDIAGRNELWRAQIYAIQIDKNLERDIQDVFITSLAVEGGTLLITNEKGESYALDLATRKVTKRNK